MVWGRGEVKTANGCGVSLKEREKCSKIRLQWWLPNSMNILNNTEFYTLN